MEFFPEMPKDGTTLFCAAVLKKLEDVLDLGGHSLSCDFGRPGSLGSKLSSSVRFTSTCPPISSVEMRPFLASLWIACRETPRIRAASDCEIHSAGSILEEELVNIVNLSF